MKKMPIILVAGVMIFMLSSCGQAKNVKGVQTDKVNDIAQIGQTADERFIDYEALGIKEYEYPSEFSMGDNLKTAIAQLALSYESFDRDTPKTGDWKETFIAKFIQNSRLSFDYLDLISDKNNGQISIDELNYIQYSLTNTELDFSSDINGSINRYEAASPFNYGSISGYDYEETDSGVLITADLEVGYDGTESTQKYEITAELVRDPYSCFDGYSVAAFSSKPVTDNAPENQEPSSEEAKTDLYEGEYCGYEVNGVIRLEEDIATVTFMSQEWVDFAGLSEYKFYKTSDVPNIYVYE